MSQAILKLLEPHAVLTRCKRRRFNGNNPIARNRTL
jgi:hypothetical protein